MMPPLEELGMCLWARVTKPDAFQPALDEERSIARGPGGSRDYPVGPILRNKVPEIRQALLTNAMC